MKITLKDNGIYGDGGTIAVGEKHEDGSVTPGSSPSLSRRGRLPGSSRTSFAPGLRRKLYRTRRRAIRARLRTIPAALRLSPRSVRAGKLCWP